MSIQQLKPPRGTKSGKTWVARGNLPRCQGHLSVYLGSFHTREEAERAEAWWWATRGGKDR
jgi:hypothetical protein